MATTIISGYKVEFGYRDMSTLQHLPDSDVRQIAADIRRGFMNGHLSYYQSPGWWCVVR